ncbi:glycine-rich domain-containing protein [Klebsiella variicola]|uniref:glycine-rich domain-containing protein n=1 Tax=Klebsiella variicola TaxID=244366 RepID=UPI0003BFA79D|nr:hypothetical protein [Klebsiella variicola]ESN40835.1 hypothetical protein L366_03250 [Klebsiella variicola]
MLQQEINSNISTGPLSVSVLEKIMEYQNDDLIHKFCKEWDVTREQARDIFEETKKFLYLAATCQTQCVNITVHQQIQVIDEMWHTFVLFTDQYYHFCEKYLGGFLHHFPFTRKMLRSEIKFVNSTDSNFETYKQNTFRSQIMKISEILGQDTVVKWYGEYAVQYSLVKLNALRRPLTFGEQEEVTFSVISEDILSLPKNEVFKIIMGSKTTSRGCGCSGRGCGAGCSCNSR